MKSLIVITISIAGALGATVSPLAGAPQLPLDARPEALVTGGVLLVLAAILRRGRNAKATSRKPLEALSAGRSAS